MKLINQVSQLTWRHRESQNYEIIFILDLINAKLKDFSWNFGNGTEKLYKHREFSI